MTQIKHRRWVSTCRLLPLFLIALTVGCAHRDLALAPVPLPDGGPVLANILQDLRWAEDSITAFHAQGRMTLRAPELEAVQVLPHTSIYFEKPARLHVSGRRYGHNAFRLYVDAGQTLLELPTEKAFSYQDAEDAERAVSAEIAPAALAQVLFLPESWLLGDPDTARIMSYDAQEGTAELALPPAQDYPYSSELSLTRLNVEGAARWAPVRLLVYQDDGLVAEVERSEYQVFDGVPFPLEVTARYPAEDAAMAFSARPASVEMNLPIEPRLFAAKARLAALRAEGYEALRPEPAQGAEFAAPPSATRR